MDMHGLKIRLQRTENPESGFLSQISRDMKTSLDGIIGFTHLLASQRSGALNEKQARYVSEIYDGGRQLHTLVNDYMDLAKIDSGMLDLNLSELDANEYILWVLEVLQPRMSEKKIIFTVVWETPSEKIIGDSARLQQILFILLSKAVEFSAEEERILLKVAFNAEFMEVHLKNDSSEDSPEDSHESRKLSEPEEPFDENSNSFDVSMALAIKLIQMHGGEIGLEFEEKGGSYLWFTLSKNMNPYSDTGGKTAEPRSNSKTNPHRILLVDDNNNMQNLVVEILKKDNCTVFVADNGRAGLELAQECRPDMILMDINMPVMDGREAIKQLRALPGLEKIPVVAFTAYDIKDSGQELLKLGFTRYLNKPFCKQDLLHTIHTCLPSA